MEIANKQLPAGYVLDHVWMTKTPALQAELIDFWLRTGALPTREQAEARVPQAMLLARAASSGQIVAVSTVYVQFNQQLGHPFYYFRCFVEEAHRRSALAINLLTLVYDELNARFVAGEQPQILGMVLEVQNAAINQQFTQAVWPRTGFVYIGRNAQGDYVRVAYFDGARIA